MKLPEELKAIAGKHWFDPAPTFLSMFTEAIVRDCAKMCFDESDRLMAVGAGCDAEKFRIKACAILARFGLELKE